MFTDICSCSVYIYLLFRYGVYIDYFCSILCVAYVLCSMCTCRVLLLDYTVYKDEAYIYISV